jgi:MFS family permease
MKHDRLVPIIVAVALFMDNMDSTVIATSLPAIATDIGTSPLTLKLAVTSYLLSLAVFIPMSGWTADRFGARTVFRAAIGVFVLGSIGCALSSSVSQFVLARIIQGMGGAMMTPVGRLVLVRTVDRRELVNAMAWVSIPAMIGPLMGPPLGGFITTYASWHWIFLINVPIGLIGIVLVTLYIENIKAEVPERFDFPGMLLSSTAVAGLTFGLSVAGFEIVPWPVVLLIIGIGLVALGFYLAYARRAPAPILDFSLLKLMLKQFGFRNVLISNAILGGLSIAACAIFRESTPFWIMIAILMLGGFFRSLQFTSVNALAYAEVPRSRMSRATALAAVGQQVSLATGVAIGALAVEIVARMNDQGIIMASDFPPGFLLVGLIAASSAAIFWLLPPNAGAEMANRVPATTSPSDQRMGS